MKSNRLYKRSERRRRKSSTGGRTVGHLLNDTSSPETEILQGGLSNRTAQRLVIQLRRQRRPRTAIGYVGLNPQAQKEARALRRGSRDRVIVSLDDMKDQSILQTWDGKINFIYYGLGIDWEADLAKFFRALHCLQSCDTAFCDQMADMMQMFHSAENGEYQLERLVLSGHHAGGTMWGDNTDKHEPGEVLLKRDLPNLVAAFPEAAAQVEDIMFSACNTKAQVELCVSLFPNLQSVWIYEGYSPSIKQGSARHITKWERQTRGRHTPRKRDAIGNTELWTKDQGFLINPELHEDD